ncbi:MAG: homeobox domain-containing protein, partial [Olpidium bornovanus]
MPAEAKILVDFFETGKRKPDYEERKRLGDQLNMTPREVQVWFQNRRAKAKKVERSTANAGGAGGNASSPAGPAYETTRPGYTAPGPAPAS